jgi:thioredoxin 1
LTHAKPVDLPEGVLLRCGELCLTEKDLSQEIAKGSPEVQGQLKKNKFFVLENMATGKLLLLAAKAEAAKAGKDISGKSDQELIKSYMAGRVGEVKVTDREVAEFYQNNQDVCGGAKLEQVRAQIEPYLVQQRQQELTSKQIATLGKQMIVEVSDPWTRDQVILAQDNVVDRARLSGKPSVVDFGSKGCRPCEMLAPILETLKKKYEGRANVLFVSVTQEQILAARYGIESIPVQVFFDKDGREVLRHTGFWPQAEIEKQMAKLGVK